MGVEGKKKAPLLPAFTNLESSVIGQTSVASATDLSMPGDDKSSYSLPDDGTPVTIKTRGHRQNRSQTSLLIEYFEGSKASSGAAGPSEIRKPSIRVRVTPSGKKGKSSFDRDHIQIRKASANRQSQSPLGVPHDAKALAALSGAMLTGAYLEDVKSMDSYASATEESSVSRNPIEIEIDRSGNGPRRRPASPLIPTAESKTSYLCPNMSEISAIPTDSFLDGSDPTASAKVSEAGRRERSRTRSPSHSRVEDVSAAFAAADKMRGKSRCEIRERERVVLHKRDDKDRVKLKSKSRQCNREKDEKDLRSERRRSSKIQLESVGSATESSLLSAGLSLSHRSLDQHSVHSGTSKASSINNPRLLETVEDAIRRLILPELTALKREQSKHQRRSSANSSTTSVSREEYASDRRRHSVSDKTARESIKNREKRDREARHELDESLLHSQMRHESVQDTHEIDDTPMRGRDKLKATAEGAALGNAAATAMHTALFESRLDDKRTRRRRRAELRSRDSEVSKESPEEQSTPAPLMPLMSEMDTSEQTRTSILSAETDRPHSATEELTPVDEISGVQTSNDPVRSIPSSPTPTKSPVTATLQSLGTQHANVSRGDLRALPRQRHMLEQDYDRCRYGQPGTFRQEERYDEDEECKHPGSVAEDRPPSSFDFYGDQNVPPPLKYVPYQPERRGLSPIPSVSGYTEGGSEPPNRDSRTSRSESYSSPEKSPRQDGMYSPRSTRSNMVGRDFADDDQSLRSSGLDFRNTTHTEDSDPGGRAVHTIGVTPNIVQASGIESNVASLVDDSMAGSALTTNSGAGGNQAYHDSFWRSMETLEEQQPPGNARLATKSIESHRICRSERADSPVSAIQRSRSFTDEYDLDEYGRKVSLSSGRPSPTASEAAITGAAVGAAAAALRAQQDRLKQSAPVGYGDNDAVVAGLQRNRSFKERAMYGQVPGLDAEYSVDHMVDDQESAKMGFSRVPLAEEPALDGAWHGEVDSVRSGARATADSGHVQNEAEWNGDRTPRQQTPSHESMNMETSFERAHKTEGHTPRWQHDDSQGLDITQTAGAAAVVAAAALAAAQQHNRQPSQAQQDDEWYRTSDDRKRDTILTNPYEGTSPFANLPGLNEKLLGAGFLFRTNSPLGRKVDEGYISQGPNKTPDMRPAKGKGVESANQPGADDPFYVPNQTGAISGMSQAVGSPFCDGATGAAIDGIESKDILALMQHLMVRDAQRSARDTEILVTIVNAAAEMRSSFDDIRRMIADSEDVIITEVKENTEKTVTRAINGPRPYPGSAPQSVQAASHSTAGEDLPTKKRNFFRKALKGLSAKGANDLARIEDMLMQLLSQVEVLKTQTAPGASPASNGAGKSSFDEAPPELQYEQDPGYETEGRAGTSSTSHGSRSGHYLISQSRGNSARTANERKVSAHRISTVYKANEDDYDGQGSGDHGTFDAGSLLMTPAIARRGASAPLETPPKQGLGALKSSLSNENTPRTEESKKTKSGSRSSWFPKISRWSETTVSSFAKTFRHSGQSRKTEDGSTQFVGGASRPASIGSYSDNSLTKPDKLQEDLSHCAQSHNYDQGVQRLERSEAHEEYRMTPGEPKYKAHRDSLNLAHPQPSRPGQPERHKMALESQAMGFDSPTSPRSADWAGSAISLNRFPRSLDRGSAASFAGQQNPEWQKMPLGASDGGPPRPPKEPVDGFSGAQPPFVGSPLPNQNVESTYGTMTHGVPTASHVSHSSVRESPRYENRTLNNALSVPTRRPTGPRAMTPRTGGGSDRATESADGGPIVEKRNRDTFGVVASPGLETC